MANHKDGSAMYAGEIGPLIPYSNSLVKEDLENDQGEVSHENYWGECRVLVGCEVCR